jgi:hypothetical protein
MEALMFRKVMMTAVAAILMGSAAIPATAFAAGGGIGGGHIGGIGAAGIYGYNPCDPTWQMLHPGEKYLCTY